MKTTDNRDQKTPAPLFSVKPPRVGVIVLNHNSSNETLACLESLRAADGGERHTWVVDNASSDDSSRVIPRSLLSGESWLETGANLGYAGGNNAGIREAMAWGAEYLLLLNPDVRVSQDFLPPLLKALEALPRAGMASPLVLDEKGEKIQSFGGRANLWTGRCARALYGLPRSSVADGDWCLVDFPHGACVLIKRGCIEEVGLFNEAYFLYYEDVEFGLRSGSEGFIVLAVGRSVVKHRDTTASGAVDPEVLYHATRNQAWVVARHGSPPQRLSFLLLSLLFRWPVKILIRLSRINGKAALAVLRGAAAGILGSVHPENRMESSEVSDSETRNLSQGQGNP